MYEGKLVFSQVMDHAPQHLFRKCVRRYGGNRYVKSFPCWSQFLCMAFAQLSYRASLRDIEISLRAHRRKLYHMGIHGNISRNTLANANRRRDWRIYAAFAQELITIARPLYTGDSIGLELDNTVYALDASTIDLCMSVFPWALFRSTKSAVKLHTLLDLHGNIPAFIHISHAKVGDVNALDLLIPEPGAFYIMDRAYLDFERLNVIHSMGAFFVIRAKSNTRYRRRYSRPVDKATGVKCDQTIVLTGVTSSKDYPQPLRRVKYRKDGRRSAAATMRCCCRAGYARRLHTSTRTGPPIRWRTCCARCGRRTRRHSSRRIAACIAHLVEGVPIEVARENGSTGGDTVWLIDFTDADSNDWLAVNQYTVIEG